MGTTTQFSSRPRRDDPNGHMVVWQMVQELRDDVDKFINQFLQGSATVTSGNTTVVVTHGLNKALYQVLVVPTVDPAGRWWVSTKTSTQFTINLQTAAPIGGISFDWTVKAG